MMRRFTGRFGVAVAAAMLVLSLGAGAVMAGEVTGSGKNIDQNQGKSWCSFSGLNDKLPGEGPTGPQSQSFGQDVKLGMPGSARRESRLLLQPEPLAAGPEPEPDPLTFTVGPALGSGRPPYSSRPWR